MKSDKNIFWLLLALLALQVGSGGLSYALDETEACVPNVLASLQSLPKEATRLGVNTRGHFPGRMFTQSVISRFGLDNHFQGVLRLKNASYFLISAADYWHKQGYVFVNRLDSKQGLTGNEAWGTNLKGIRPNKNDGTIYALKVGEAPHWHPGGMARMGDVVGIPTEEYKITNTAVVEFYDFSRPEFPKLLTKIERSHNDAGNLSMVKDDDGRTVAMTYTGGELEFYRTNTKSIRDGFNTQNTLVWNSTQDGRGLDVGGSSVNLIRQCDGRVFLVNFENTGKLPPIFNKDEKINVFEVSWSFEKRKVKIEPVTSLTFDCRGYCNFGGAAGTHITPNGSLAVYSSKFYRNYFGNKIKIGEFF